MVLQVLETILCIGTSNKQVKILIQQIQNSVQQRKWPCFIRYIRVHLHLPGSLVEGNALDHKFPKTGLSAHPNIPKTIKSIAAIFLRF